jgi:hypothetical protein
VVTEAAWALHPCDACGGKVRFLSPPPDVV